MSVTLRDVARLAGVSFKTVSNVVNQYPHVRADTRARVEAAIAQLGYQPNIAARNLRSGRTGTITLALPDIRLPYFAELADDIVRASEKRGLTVVIEQTDGKRERELAMLSGRRLQNCDGLLFSPLGLGQADAALVQAEVPIVLLGERIFAADHDHVTMRNVEAARAATEYLLSLGRRRIAVVGAHRDEVIGSAGLRTRGYREALAARGIEFDEQLLSYQSLWHRSQGAAGAHDLIDREVEFDAVFGLNDTLALGAMRVLQEAGLRVPQDIAVLGFDNLDETQFSLPTLTSVDPGKTEIVETAIDLLIERIDGGSDDPPREIKSAFTIVERESTATL